MKVETVKKLTIEIEGVDADNFKSGLKKVCAEFKKVGLNNSMITVEEADVIKKLSENL